MIDLFKYKKYIIVVVLLFVLPSFIFAQTNSQGSIIPNCGVKDASGNFKECGFSDLLKLVDNLLRWIVMISIPVSAGVFAWAGFQLMTTGIADKRSQAKSMMIKVFIGFVFILSAWLIVGTILDALLASSFRNNIKL